MANPIPVFPEVGSTKVLFPGEMSPRASASLIILRAIRSLTLLAGLDDSSLATISAPQDGPATLVILTRGVRPMSSRILLAILGRGAAKRADELASVLVDGLMLDAEGAKELLAWKSEANAEATRMNFMVYLVIVWSRDCRRLDVVLTQKI